MSNLLMIKGKKSISLANDLAKDTSIKIISDANKINNLLTRIPSKRAPLIIRLSLTQTVHPFGLKLFIFEVARTSQTV